MKVIYEDNHIIIVAKESGEIVQGDKTGDKPLSETVKEYLKEKYHKPGEVFLGVCHRLDRPVAGLVVFARTSKALARLNRMFAEGEVHKTYWAIVGSEKSEVKSEKYDYTATRTSHFSLLTSHFETLSHWLVRNEKQNKSYAYDREVPHSKKAQLEYRVIGQGERYQLLEVKLLTGRHHQIRAQLSHIGCPIKGDLKYGARRSNEDGSICLHARRLRFEHPVSHIIIDVVAPPFNPLFEKILNQENIDEK